MTSKLPKIFSVLACAGIFVCAVTFMRPLLVAQSESTAEMVVMKNVMVTMRDGTKLATDIYRPAKNGAAIPGKFPVIMERTPYNKDGIQSWARSFVPHGYVAVGQDLRGRFHSEGKWRPFRDDGNDGFDTAKWLAEQPWSDAILGTVGTSYAGGTQHALAFSNPPSLKAMVPAFSTSNSGRYGMRHDGAFELQWTDWVISLGNALPVEVEKGAQLNPNAQLQLALAVPDPAQRAAVQEFALHSRDFVKSLPIRAGATPLKYAPEYESWIIEALSHGDYDDYWKKMGVGVIDNMPRYKDVPIYHVTGWYDSLDMDVNLNFMALSKEKKSLQRLIAGPWAHGGQSRSNAGEADFGPDAKIDFDALRLRWFDKWLKGVNNGVDREPKIRIFVMGGGDAHKTPEGRIFVGGHWRNENEWPLARTAPTPYYLQAGGGLSTAKPGPSQPSRYSFDPKHPVPSMGGNISNQGILTYAGGAMDQRCRADYWLCEDTRPLSARKDIVVFQTPPLDRDIEVTGRLLVKLWASSNAPDTDFTAKLIDVYPPNADFPAGVDLNIAEGIIRARYRDSIEKATMMTPGQVYPFNFEMYPTSVVFKRGHRIRIDISSSNFPRFDLNPNTGEPLNNNTRWAIAENAIYHDAEHPSQIVLPIIPAGAAAGN
jgi:uncharacterized protein